MFYKTFNTYLYWCQSNSLLIFKDAQMNGDLNSCTEEFGGGLFTCHAIMPETSAAARYLTFCAWLSQAEEFRDTVHMLLEWLSEAEQTLRFRGALPDDTEALQSLIDTHKVIQPQMPWSWLPGPASRKAASA